MEAVTQMNLSFETLVTTFIASSFLFLIACIVFISSRRIRAVGYQALTFICVLSVIRLIIPVEFFFFKESSFKKNLVLCYCCFSKAVHYSFSNTNFCLYLANITLYLVNWQYISYIWLYKKL